jgi:hypothetical protein
MRACWVTPFVSIAVGNKQETNRSSSRRQFACFPSNCAKNWTTEKVYLQSIQGKRFKNYYRSE